MVRPASPGSGCCIVRRTPAMERRAAGAATDDARRSLSDAGVSPSGEAVEGGEEGVELGGQRSTAELMAALGLDRGQLYHHLRDLFVQGLVRQPQRDTTR